MPLGDFDIFRVLRHSHGSGRVALSFKVCRLWLGVRIRPQCVLDKRERAVIVCPIRAQQNNAFVVRTMPNVLY